MQPYLQNLAFVMNNGTTVADRTGKGRHRVFSPPQERYDMREGFPLVTTREINPKAMIDELVNFFIPGHTSIEALTYKFFWKDWAVTMEQALDWALKKSTPGTPEYTKALDWALSKVGTIGPMYGYFWRNAPSLQSEYSEHPKRSARELPRDFIEKYFKENFYHEQLEYFKTADEFWEHMDSMTFDSSDLGLKAAYLLADMNVHYWKKYDQLNELIVGLKTNPYSSRHRVTAMFPEFTALESLSPQENVLAGRGCLTPCHTFFQCFVAPGIRESDRKKLSMQMYISSNDMPVGRVYNIAQYSLLLSMIAHVVDMEAHEFIITTGDGHIYSNQKEKVCEQLQRSPLKKPTLWLNPEVKDFFAFTSDDIRIEGYECLEKIAYPVAV